MNGGEGKLGTSRKEGWVAMKEGWVAMKEGGKEVRCSSNCNAGSSTPSQQ